MNWALWGPSKDMPIGKRGFYIVGRWSLWWKVGNVLGVAVK
jgi:hypothetical protein